MRAELVAQTLNDLWEIKRPVYITGAPGGGKTSITKQFAEKVGADYIHKHMPTMLVEDFGIPFPSADNASFDYRLPKWFPADPDTKAVLCFDDRGQCSQDLQKVVANIEQERELHGCSLPSGVMVVSTGNRVGDKAGANRVLTHLADRETEIELDTNLDDWCKWAIDEGVTAEVVSFIRFRANLLHDFDPQRPKNPTPRSWVEGVSAILGTVRPEAEYECFKGAVGEGAAAEFVGYMKIYRNLPNPDAILLHPDKHDVPTDPATLYALSGSLAERANEGNFSKIITYFNRMPPEFGVLGVSYATRKNEELASTQAFTNWAVENQEVLF
tara:strand:- start:8453 stop:9436 length:984 start_codon:yes stop_codon:yes gene_type:complete